MENPIIKKRKISIVESSNLGNTGKIEERLMRKDGMISASVDCKKNVIRVEYDLKKIKFEVIEKSIQDMKFELSKKIIRKLKRGMAKFTEQNELDNLTATVSSCCDDPKGKAQGCRKSIL